MWARPTALQRLPTVALGIFVHGTWHEDVIGSTGSAAGSMTGIEGVAVIQRGWPQIALSQLAIACLLLEGPISRFRPTAEVELDQMSRRKPYVNVRLQQRVACHSLADLGLMQCPRSPRRCGQIAVLHRDRRTHTPHAQGECRRGVARRSYGVVRSVAR